MFDKLRCSYMTCTIQEWHKYKCINTYNDRLITNCFSGQFLGWVWRCALVRNAENRGKNLYLWSYELIFFLMIFYVKSNLDLSFNW